MCEEQSNIRFCTLKAEHAKKIARLHSLGVPEGFISSLGEEFIGYIYEGVASSGTGFGFVAVKDGEVIGFICCAESVSSIYKYILKKHFFRLVFVILPKMFRFCNVRNAIETLLYPSRAGSSLPSVEILAIVVEEKARNRGIGQILVERAINESVKRGVGKMKVMVGEPLAANLFYAHLGFQLVGRYRHHGHLANAYVKVLGKDVKS